MPLKDALTVVGIIVLVVGMFVGFGIRNLFFILAVIVGGFVLLALGKLIAIAEAVQHKLLEIPYTKDQIRSIIKKSPTYTVEADDLEIYPDPDTRYPLILLDDEYNIRARVFYKYLSQKGDEYDFSLPGQEVVTLTKSENYFKGVELFAMDEQVFVLLKSLNYWPFILGNRVVLERETRANESESGHQSS